MTSILDQRISKIEKDRWYTPTKASELLGYKNSSNPQRIYQMIKDNVFPKALVQVSGGTEMWKKRLIRGEALINYLESLKD